MYEKFNDPEKAVSYLSSGLLHDFPDAHAEVIWFFNHRARHEDCDVAHISTVLGRMCGKFPKASVEYRPEHPYGYVAEIQCHGELNPSRDTQFMRRPDGSDRARVVVLLTRVHNEDVMVGVSMAPREPGLVESTRTA